MAGEFDRDPTLPLSIPLQYNFHDLTVVLPEVIHVLTDEPVLRLIVNSVSVNDDSYYDDDDAPDFFKISSMLLDLDVSYHQGSAFMKDKPLDMRMCRAIRVRLLGRET